MTETTKLKDQNSLRSSNLKNEYLEFLKVTSPESFVFDVSHIELISEYLLRMVDGEIKRLCINIPPRHGKSETVTVRFPAFLMQKFRDINIMVAGYNQGIARRFSRKSRQIVADRIGLDEKNASVDEWRSKNNNYYYAASTSNPRTGIGFNWIILDDLVKSREEANSKTHCDQVYDFYREDCYSRLEPDGRMIIVNTRWSENDIIARAIETEPENWTILNLPAICDDPDTDILNRSLDEPLWPERYSYDQLMSIKKVTGDFAFASLYQQRPVPKEGGLFKPDRIKIDTPPKMIRKVRAWDLASTGGKGDYTAGVLLGVDEDQHYWLLDVYRERVSTDVRDKKIFQIASMDGVETRICIPQDPGSAGKSMKDYFIKMLAGFIVIPKIPSGTKEVRAEPIAIQINEGNLSLSRGAWNSVVLNEIGNFPYGANDDIIDALSDAFSEISKVRGRKFFAV